ncbi:dolichol-phosphate mannosyltransferase subunit 3-like [Stylophora pistillata]|uniref:Dolichol-phosphate mannosyltransferase subunit 3 n=1 Tax=Stylophora pistillata TaxID=50429 RepID=A0A2B4RBY9_STYPI|nr:dolichol-phosphate mannosyltransferase subunit 3-like [Stylophora pistillata]PFX13887.1 Dolichol-phosphate mannosyltransferase subunit 3 [Stylophora pistillata]
MTKLTEWIIFAALAFSLWITLLSDILPLKVSYKAKEVIWPIPVYALIVFGCYSLATIGYRVATFNDCVEASESLKQEINDAREDLSKRGFKFD